MVIRINNTDIVPYIAFGGVKWTRQDVDGPDAGRTMDSLMHRERIATKIRMDITCKPLTAAETSIVLNLIYPEYVTVEYDDPMLGRVTKTMYSNNNPATYLMKTKHGTEYWTGITFPLIER